MTPDLSYDLVGGRERRRPSIIDGMEKKRYLHLGRFVVLSNELQNPKYGRSASGAERPTIIPSSSVSLTGSNQINGKGCTQCKVAKRVCTWDMYVSFTYNRAA